MWCVAKVKDRMDPQAEAAAAEEAAAEGGEEGAAAAESSPKPRIVRALAELVPSEGGESAAAPSAGGVGPASVEQVQDLLKQTKSVLLSGLLGSADADKAVLDFVEQRMQPAEEEEDEDEEDEDEEEEDEDGNPIPKPEKPVVEKWADFEGSVFFGADTATAIKRAFNGEHSFTLVISGGEFLAGLLQGRAMPALEALDWRAGAGPAAEPAAV